MLDSEGVQKLITGPSSVATSMSSAVSRDIQSEANIQRAKSPLSQAMLQIHSPDSVPDINIGETVVLQMEEGRATLIAHPENGLLLDKQTDAGGSGQKSLTNSDSDEVFDRDKEEMKGEVKVQPSLHSVISNLISAQVVNFNREENKIVSQESGSNIENEAKKMADIVAVKQTPEILMKSDTVVESKGSNSGIGNAVSKGSNSPTLSVGKGNGEAIVTGKAANSQKQRKSQSGELVVPQPNVSHILGGQTSVGSPVTAVTPPAVVHERKKSHRGASKVPHPAFNIPVTTLDKRSGGIYNYNLPDRGLGAMNSSPGPLSASPPTVSVPRFPATASTVIPGTVLGFMSPSWPLQRPVEHSPASNDSHSSGSPLDLSNVREASPNLTNKILNDAALLAAGKPVATQQLSPKDSVVSETVQASAQNLKVVTVQEASAADEHSVMLNGENEKQTTQSVNMSKVPYTQEMLYLFDKELEIVAVGKNKWIIRNENELVNVVKKKSDVEQNNVPSMCTNCSDDSDSAKKVLGQNGSSPNGTEFNKRQIDLETDPQRSKVTKLVNGDVHSSSAVSVQSISASGISSQAETITNNTDNRKTEENSVSMEM